MFCSHCRAFNGGRNAPNKDGAANRSGPAGSGRSPFPLRSAGASHPDARCCCRNKFPPLAPTKTGGLHATKLKGRDGASAWLDHLCPRSARSNFAPAAFCLRVLLWAPRAALRRRRLAYLCVLAFLFAVLRASMGRGSRRRRRLFDLPSFRPISSHRQTVGWPLFRQRKGGKSGLHGKHGAG